MGRPSDPLLNSAMRVLEIEAIDNPDAAHLLDLLDSLPEQGWAALRRATRHLGRTAR
jgi:hypothetical protein